MALFSRKLRNTDAANLQVSVQLLISHVIYMQDALERKNTELEKEMKMMRKEIEELRGNKA